MMESRKIKWNKHIWIQLWITNMYIFIQLTMLYICYWMYLGSFHQADCSRPDILNILNGVCNIQFWARSSKGPSMKKKDDQLFSPVLLYSTYSNLCDLFTRFLDKNGTAQCPPILQQNNFPCTCPFLPGHYHINPVTFKIKPLKDIYQQLQLAEVSTHVLCFMR